MMITLQTQAASAASIAQQAYLKASNPGANDQFGLAVAVSGDTMVVGAPGESSGATGVNGDQDDESAPFSGAVYVFVRVGTNWIHQAYLKGANTEEGDNFGYAVTIAGDTVVVGAWMEDSSAIGVNGNPAGNSALDSGAAYVFVRNGSNWTQQAYLKASNSEAGDGFGFRVAVSGDTVAVAAPNEDSNATGVNGNQGNNSSGGAGAAYVFVRQGTNWTQQAYLKASNTQEYDYFGQSVAVFGDTLVVGAVLEASDANGVNGNQNDNGAPESGAAYVFMRNGTNWTQQAYLKASNSGYADNFGCSVDISANTIVVGALGESSNATGVNGNQNNENAYGAGAAYVFVRNGTTWSQQAYLKASNTGGTPSISVGCIGDYCGDGFGWSVAVDGDTVVVGAWTESSRATGVNGLQTDNSTTNAGAAYVFVRNGTTWTQQAYLKASNTEAGDNFGSFVSVAGGTVLVGATLEDSGATGVNGDQTDNKALDSGAVYIFATPPPELRLFSTFIGNMLHLTATGTANTRWRLESRDILTGTNGWQPFTNLTLGPSPTVIQQPLSSTHRFYRGAWVR